LRLRRRLSVSVREGEQTAEEGERSAVSFEGALEVKGEAHK
jgi:hypothetical protein